MNNSTSIQHMQMVQAGAGVLAAAVTALLTIAGRWIGGAWVTLLATLGCVLAAFHPLISSTLFGNIETDRMQMILLALIPFTLLLVGTSFRQVPWLVRAVIALVGPAIILTWVFHNYAPAEPRQLIYVHRILPIAIAVFAGWVLIEPIAVRSPGPAAPMVIALLGTAMTLLLMLSAEMNAGLICTPIAGAAGGAAVAGIAGWFFKGRPISLARGPVLLWLTALGAMFAYLWISDDELPQKYLLWLASVPLLAWIPEIGPIHRLRPWLRESIRFALVVIPVVLTMVLSYRQHAAEQKAAGDEYGLLWPSPPQSAAPILPRKMPIPNTINPPTIT